MTHQDQQHPRWIPDPVLPGKIRLVQDEAEHERINPEDHAKFVRERQQSTTVKASQMADDDYARGYRPGKRHHKHHHYD